ncbi:uncharacterized protein DNG_04825 [Cephalotrichum gorgonifer]|uniref:Nascent polypeptide-associated complex subunit alpha-like UBA domain-containing protein n=1 Tax=Cephalotrichum gorgonifer TaxID=2041049 RepID=A0AAE8MX60_9PEZI|nr:uncharacterized protein DNG_04825 [Cephalotrichum gorgonifer]
MAASDHPEEIPEDTRKSAEDRKAASALANLNAEPSPQGNGNVDQAAVSAAMKKLGGGKGGVSLPIRGNVKIEQADVALLVEQLDLAKGKATELLKSNDGNAVKALRAFVQGNV